MNKKKTVGDEIDLPRDVQFTFVVEMAFESAPDESGVPVLRIHRRMNTPHLTAPQEVLAIPTIQVPDKPEARQRLSLFRDFIERELWFYLRLAVYEAQDSATIMTFQESLDFMSVGSDRALDRLIRSRLQDHEAMSRARLDIPKVSLRGGSHLDCDYSKLAYHYDSLHPVWKRAKQVFKNNRNDNWKAMVQAGFSELSTQADLVERLDDARPAPEGYGDDGRDTSHQPNSIALEHSARLCGAAPYARSIKTLRDHLTRSRKNLPIEKDSGATYD